LANLASFGVTHHVYFCLIPRRFFADGLPCDTSGGGATESLKFNNVSKTMFFAGLVSPSLRSSNNRAAVVLSYLDKVAKADDEQQPEIDRSAVQAALEKLEQHPAPEANCRPAQPAWRVHQEPEDRLSDQPFQLLESEIKSSMRLCAVSVLSTTRYPEAG
jgi:hypothetical protein